MRDHRAINHANWESRVPFHVASDEHDSVPWPALDDQMAEDGDGEFRLLDRPERLPHRYTLRAVER